MKTKTTQLSTTTLALCGMLLAMPSANAAENASLNASDTLFIEKATANNQTKLKMATIGANQAVTPEVKSYAAMLVSDHTKSGHALTKLAVSKHLELSEEVDAAHAKDLQTLKDTDAATFDSKFLAQMVNDHKACIVTFEKVSKEAADPEVKAFATETLPTLQAHLKKGIELSLLSTTGVNTAPDNTARNQRDIDGKQPTPFDQGNSKSDTEITASIRKGIISKDMSMNAQNVKIITQNGKVTLRGPVNSDEEKRVITEIAGQVVHADAVDCQLEVK